jgi:hypothetical protein
MSQSVITANGHGVVTVPFFVVGAPEPDLTVILRALKVRIPNHPVAVSAALLSTKTAKAVGQRVLDGVR